VVSLQVYRVERLAPSTDSRQLMLPRWPENG
jgi:hypothetical protein